MARNNRKGSKSGKSPKAKTRKKPPATTTISNEGSLGVSSSTLWDDESTLGFGSQSKNQFWVLGNDETTTSEPQVNENDNSPPNTWPHIADSVLRGKYNNSIRPLCGIVLIGTIVWIFGSASSLL